MYSDFCTYFEILAALYTSMCLDDILKNIWTPSFYKDLERELGNSILEGHGDMAERMVKEASNKVDSIKRYMKNRSMFLLILTIAIILLFGLEDMYANYKNEEIQLVIETTIPTMVMVAFLTIIFFNEKLFDRPQHLFLSFFGVILLTFLFIVVNELFMDCFRFPIAIGICIVLILMTLPILWQLFVLWVFTNGYKVYISELLRKEKDKYNRIVAAINSNDTENIPQEYLNNLGKLAIQKTSEQNREQLIVQCLNDYLEEMDNEIAQAGRMKSILKIFFSWMSFSVKNQIQHILIYIGVKSSKKYSQNA